MKRPFRPPGTVLRLLSMMSAPGEPTRLDIARDWLEFSDAEFIRTRNPVYAWDAVAEALVHDLPLPKSIRDYLIHAAGTIGRMSRDNRKRPGKGRPIAPAVAAALGFSGRGRTNPFKAIEQATHELQIAFDVYQCHTRNRANHQRGLEPTHDWTTVFQDAARSHKQRCEWCRRTPSVKTVERYWRMHALDVIPPRLIARAKSHKIDDILR